MKYLIISFKSRNSVMRFANIMRKNNLFASIINTPKSIYSSCGLSIRTEFRNLHSITSLLQNLDCQDLIGVYAITRKGLYEKIEKFY